MKKNLIIAALLLILPLSLSAQTKSFREFYDKYSGMKGYTSVEMSGEMFNSMGGSVVMGRGNVDISPLAKQISALVIIISEKSTRQFSNDIGKLIETGNYSRLLVNKDGGQTSEFYVIQKRGKTVELLMIVRGGNENVVMSIVGKNLNIAQISKIGSKRR